MELTKNKAVLDWIDQQVKLTQPKEVIWIDGSEAQLEELRKEACATGEIYKLNQEKLPGCYLHRSDPSDVARVESRTFICCKKQEDAGPTNNWMDPQEMYAKLNKLYDGSMKGKTMYVIPYCMGVVGSPFAKYGIELTDSIYVVLNMAIMTRVGTKAAAYLDDSDDFVKGLHAKADPGSRRSGISFTSLRTTPSCPSTPATAATCSWARSALPCASPPTWAVKRAGWPSICSSWACAEPPGRGAVHHRRFPLCLRQDQPGHADPPGGLPEERAGRSGAWATTSPGCVSAPTAACGP